MKNSKQYIDLLVNKLLKETLEDKANKVMEKLNFKPGKSFDYVQEGKMCESCGSEMTEGNCMECGYKSGEVMEKLHGKQRNIDKNRNGRIDAEDFKMLRGKKNNGEMKETKYVTSPRFKFDREEIPMSRQDMEIGMDNMPGFNKEDNYDYKNLNKFTKIDNQDFQTLRGKNTEMSEEDEYSKMCESCGGEMREGESCESCGGNMTGEVMEKLYGRQSKLDKNKNGRLDSEDFKMIRRKKSEMSEMSGKDEVCEGCGSEMGKVQETVYRLVDGNNTELFTENEIIDIIENIVKEEKKKEDNITKGASHRGYSEYEKAHKGSGKENKQYLDSVAKKLTEYLKDGSKGKYDTNPKQFPRGNGELAKMDKKAYEIDEEGTDFNYEVAGLNIPDYDGKGPKKEFIEKQIKGSSTNGNDQSYGNAVNTGVNDKFAKYFENDQLAKWKDESYGRVPSPVYDEITEKGKTKGKTKLKEEFDRMKGLIGYDRKTQ